MNLSFKNSKVHWLGKVPKDWDVVPLKRHTSYISRGKSPDYIDDREKGVPIINQACICWDGLRLKNVKLQDPEAINGYRGQLYPGDLLINSTGTGTLGRICIFDLNTKYLADSHVTIVRPTKELYTKYLYYLLQTDVYQGYIYSVLASGSTNQIELSREGLSNTPVILPPHSRQKSIARFLDRKTAAIDRLIAKKQRLIQLLEEKRTALINQAVTKGLNPDVPMKDSGIPWIGEIPEHWGIIALGYVCHLTSGGTPDRNRPAYWNGKIPWVKTGEINYNQIDQTEEHITELGLKNSSTKLACASTLLMAMYGQGVTRGRVAILGIEASFNQACLAISPRQLIEIKYLYYYLMNAYQHIRDDGNETSQMNLSAGLIGKIKIILPSIEEQGAIASSLDYKVEYIDSLKKKLKSSIEKLQEYRRSLITAAVTGKLDISEVDSDV
jgi:type I restriction enzyme, S subunit